jgi:hypothetical protein
MASPLLPSPPPSASPPHDHHLLPHVLHLRNLLPHPILLPLPFAPKQLYLAEILHSLLRPEHLNHQELISAHYRHRNR